MVEESILCALKSGWQHCLVGQLIELSYNFCVDTTPLN